MLLLFCYYIHLKYALMVCLSQFIDKYKYTKTTHLIVIMQLHNDNMNRPTVCSIEKYYQKDLTLGKKQLKDVCVSVLTQRKLEK